MKAERSTLNFKSNYAVASKIEPFYMGGKVQVNKDENYIFCTCGTKINIMDLKTGKIFQSIEQDDQEDITSFALSPDDEVLVTGSRALLLKQWDWKENKCIRTWKAIHTSPVASMAFDPTSTLLATGGCDSTIKVWDVMKQYCTHNLKGSSGVVHLVHFHPDISRLQLFTSSMDCKIRVWNLKKSHCEFILESHYSAVTSLAFSLDGNTLLSSGRDSVCIIWDLKTWQPTRTIPVFESVETAILLPEHGDFSKIGTTNNGLHLVTAGRKGVLRVWEATTARCVFTQSGPSKSQEDAEEQALTHGLLLPKTNRLATVTAEHNLLFYDLHTLALQQQFVGYSDEVLDVKFLGPSSSHIVVATNSPQLKVFELETSNCQILRGHTETVLAVDVFGWSFTFASCAKDKTICIWHMNPNTGEVYCVARGCGHVSAVGSISCSRMKESFVVSGSQDCTIKVWKLPESLWKSSTVESLHVSVTAKVHDKDVNSITVSPNDKLIATGSQDRTAKLWSSTDLSLLGVFRGHKRGIWCVQFSPMDQVLATSSADGSVKLWGLQDFSCLKTFEGHDASVLKIIFISKGTQLASSGSDGLLKLWTIKLNECVKTIDAHEDKVWALSANKMDDLIVTGSADSCITLWKDVTESELAEELAVKEQQIMKQQKLSNLLHDKKYLKALGLAISLDQPHTVLLVIKGILANTDGAEQLEKTLLKLRVDQKEAILRFCTVWNTNARHCHEAQAVLEVLLHSESPEQLLQYNGIRAAVEGLIPYTERHFQRLSRLLQASMFVDYMWQSMKLPECSRDLQEEEVMDCSAPSTFTERADNDTAVTTVTKVDQQNVELTEETSEMEEDDDKEEEENEMEEEKKMDSDEEVSTIKKASKRPERHAVEECGERTDPPSDNEVQEVVCEEETTQKLRRETRSMKGKQACAGQSTDLPATPHSKPGADLPATPLPAQNSGTPQLRSLRLRR
uniref:Transducin beta like 3 n=1 Tax=Erpetoichthys calabaricus TaxID=27687 RepID=A0A8C4SWQ1_ERPCA